MPLHTDAQGLVNKVADTISKTNFPRPKAMQPGDHNKIILLGVLRAYVTMALMLGFKREDLFNALEVEVSLVEAAQRRLGSGPQG